MGWLFLWPEKRKLEERKEKTGREEIEDKWEERKWKRDFLLSNYKRCKI